jgi:hypothetical protein
MRLVSETGSSEEVRLPPGYRVDRSDPNLLVLRCPHGKALARSSNDDVSCFARKVAKVRPQLPANPSTSSRAKGAAPPA